MHDEFRVRVQLQHPKRLLDALQEAPLQDADRRELGRLAVTHEDDHVFMYADARSSAEHGKAIVERVLAQSGIAGEVSLSRWHPIEERWEDASAPLPSTEEERAAEQERREQLEREEAASPDASEWEEPAWEVRVTVPSHHDARALAERLQGEGIPVRQRWRHLLVGAASEGQAHELAERLRAEAPTGSEIVPEGSGMPFWSELHPFAAFGGIAN